MLVDERERGGGGRAKGTSRVRVLERISGTCGPPPIHTYSAMIFLPETEKRGVQARVQVGVRLKVGGKERTREIGEMPGHVRRKHFRALNKLDQ